MHNRAFGNTKNIQKNKEKITSKFSSFDVAHTAHRALFLSPSLEKKVQADRHSCARKEVLGPCDSARFAQTTLVFLFFFFFREEKIRNRETHLELENILLLLWISRPNHTLRTDTLRGYVASSFESLGRPDDDGQRPDAARQ